MTFKRISPIIHDEDGDPSAAFINTTTGDVNVFVVDEGGNIHTWNYDWNDLEEIILVSTYEAQVRTELTPRNDFPDFDTLINQATELRDNNDGPLAKKALKALRGDKS